MEFEKLAIEGAWIGHSAVHKDERGLFREWFKADDVEIIIGRKFEIARCSKTLMQ